MTPIGKCTAMIAFGNCDFVATFLVLPQCCGDMILGIHFLREHGAIINIPERSVIFSPNGASTVSERERIHAPLRIGGSDVLMPPRSCALVSVVCDNPHSGDGIAEQISGLLLNQGISIARGLVHLTEGCAEVLLTNFTNERQRIAKGTAVACFEEINNGQACFALHSDTSGDFTSPAAVDVNPDLPPDKQQVPYELLIQFADCFSTISGVHQTAPVKHRIITDETERPIHRNLYRASPREREAIRDQIE